MGSLLRSVVAFLFLAGPAFGQQAPEPSAAAETPSAAAETPGAISIELNKLVQGENVCQTYFVVDNQSPQRLGELRADVYLFNRENVVLTGFALPFLDVRPGRTMVFAFELPDLPCTDIGRVLLNNVLVCTDAAGAEVEGCADSVVVSTRTDVAFE